MGSGADAQLRIDECWGHVMGICVASKAFGSAYLASRGRCIKCIGAPARLAELRAGENKQGRCHGGGQTGSATYVCILAPVRCGDPRGRAPSDFECRAQLVLGSPLTSRVPTIQPLGSHALRDTHRTGGRLSIQSSRTTICWRERRSLYRYCARPDNFSNRATSLLVHAHQDLGAAHHL